MLYASYVLQLALFLVPWSIRRHLLGKAFGMQLSHSSYIGLSLISARRVQLADGARIGHLNFIRGLSSLVLETSARIGNLNWITAYPLSESLHFSHLTDRDPSLSIGVHSAITNRHLIDATESVSIGRFSTFGGFRSQILTHSVDIRHCRQGAVPVSIGDYCFIGTGCILLGGAKVPYRSVISAMSLVNSELELPQTLYGGVPARSLKKLDDDLQYFYRSSGFIL